MALHLPHGKLVTVGLLLALVAGCTSTDTSTPVSSAAADAPPDTPGLAPADAITEADEAMPIDSGDDGRVHAVAVDRAGEPVILVVDEQGALSVDRPLQSERAGGTWAGGSVPDMSGWADIAAIAVGPGGDVFVSGYDGLSLAVAVIDRSGNVSTTPVARPLDLATATDVTAALAPDGTVLYVAYVDGGGTPRIDAFDSRTGALVTEAELVSAIPGEVTPTEIAVAPSGDRVFVALQVETGDDRTTATLQRLSEGLQRRGEVPLVRGEVLSRTAHLVAGADGGAYASLIVGEAGTSDVEVQLVAAPAGAVTVTPVASFPGLDDVQTLAVDSSGEWAYLGGLANPPDLLALTVTPVELATGQGRPPVHLCARGELSDMVLVGGGDEAWVGGRCLDTGFASELWTLR